MKDIRVDSDGEFRCWNCGNKGLLEKRTFRSKALIGVGALLTKKKLKCQTCGEFNDTGNAKPYDGPASRKWRKQWEKVETAKSKSQRDTEARQAHLQADALASAMVAAASEFRAGNAQATPVLDEQPMPALAEPPPPSAAVPPPPAWRADPTGRHESRYWDGDFWTEHVADAGVQAVDPFED